MESVFILCVIYVAKRASTLNQLLVLSSILMQSLINTGMSGLCVAPMQTQDCLPSL